MKRLFSIGILLGLGTFVGLLSSNAFADEKQMLLIAAQKTDQVVIEGPSAWLLAEKKPLMALYTTPQGRIYLYDGQGDFVSSVNSQEWQVYLLPVVSKHHGTPGHGDGGCDSNGHGSVKPVGNELI